MLAFVLKRNGQPLMPCKPAKARKLLNAGKAKVVKRNPFTIKLLHGCSGNVQCIDVHAGGVSVVIVNLAG